MSYWARFNEDALRNYRLIIARQLRSNLEPYAADLPLKTLTNLLERMQILIGGDYAAALRVSVMIRSTISTFAAWERDPMTQRERTAGQLAVTLVETSLAILLASQPDSGKSVNVTQQPSSAAVE